MRIGLEKVVETHAGMVVCHDVARVSNRFEGCSRAGQADSRLRTAHLQQGAARWTMLASPAIPTTYFARTIYLRY
jgi:hypothetical protein